MKDIFDKVLRESGKERLRESDWDDFMAATQAVCKCIREEFKGLCDTYSLSNDFEDVVRQHMDGMEVEFDN